MRTERGRSVRARGSGLSGRRVESVRNFRSMVPRTSPRFWPIRGIASLRYDKRGVATRAKYGFATGIRHGPGYHMSLPRAARRRLTIALHGSTDCCKVLSRSTGSAAKAASLYRALSEEQHPSFRRTQPQGLFRRRVRRRDGCNGCGICALMCPEVAIEVERVKRLMSGNDAMGEAAIRAGCTAYFGYPITPQNELTEYMAKRMAEAGGVFIQAESEIAAINMVLGASAAGHGP